MTNLTNNTITAANFMTDIEIHEIRADYWTVTATTERFGENEVMFEGISEAECKAYVAAQARLLASISENAYLIAELNGIIREYSDCSKRYNPNFKIRCTNPYGKANRFEVYYGTDGSSYHKGNIEDCLREMAKRGSTVEELKRALRALETQMAEIEDAKAKGQAAKMAEDASKASKLQYNNHMSHIDKVEDGIIYCTNRERDTIRILCDRYELIGQGTYKLRKGCKPGVEIQTTNGWQIAFAAGTTICIGAACRW